jgi:hypothetical protein
MEEEREEEMEEEGEALFNIQIKAGVKARKFCDSE